jgi:putative FmdB family regulatory protein
MPIFEFTCNTCANNRRFSALVGVVANATPPACPRCGGTDLKRAVSRFARVRSEDDTLDSLAEQADNLDENDPSAMRRLMREMAGEMGEDMDDGDLEALMEEENPDGMPAGDDSAAGGWEGE